MRKRITIWDYIFLARPILLVPVWTFLLLGYFRAGGKRFFFDEDFIIVFSGYTFLLGSLYILNQIMDVKSDAINKKHLLLAEGYLPIKHAYIEFAVLILFALFLTIKLPLFTILFFALSVLFGIVYSLPPFKFKGKPILDFVINAIGYGFLNFSIGWLTQKPLSVLTICYSLPYVFAVGAIFINTTIFDIEGDKRDNSMTTGIFLGRDNALKLSALLTIFCTIMSVIVKDWLCLVPSVVALPLFLFANYKKDTKSIILSIGIGGPLLVLLTGIIFPYFLILFLLVFLFLRSYYRMRFGITYPSLSTPGR